jgi:RNA polymerase sigma-70 factor (ECF subfamily)
MRFDNPLIHDSTTVQLSLADVDDLAALLRGVREGHNAYIGRLMSLLYDGLRARLQPFAGDDTDEVISDTFLSLPTALSSYTDQGRFEHWLFRVAFNLARTKRRSQRRFDAKFADSPLEAMRDPSVIGTLTRDQLCELALANLSSAEREVWYLVYQGVPRDEIATILNISVGTVDVRLSRARKRLEPLKGLV